MMSKLFVDEMQAYFKLHGRSRDGKGHNSKIHSVGWSCDGKRVASGAYDKTINIYALEPDRLRQPITLKGHSDTVDQLAWHPSNPELLATASSDKTVKLWDSRSSKNVATTNTRGENINLCWSPNGTTIAVGNKMDVISFIDVRSHKVKHEEFFKFEVNEISWNNTGDLFVMAAGHGCINVLSYPDLKCQKLIHAHPSSCISLRFDPMGKYFAVGSVDALASLWLANEFICVRTFSRLEWPIWSVSFSFDGKILASASEDTFIDIADVETGIQLAEVRNNNPTFTVAWHPQSYLLAYACDDRDALVKVFGFPS